jgi:hypothetical protein
MMLPATFCASLAGRRAARSPPVVAAIPFEPWILTGSERAVQREPFKLDLAKILATSLRA